MHCPWCDFAGPPRAVHAHLADAHLDEVRLDERTTSRFYVITCPVCGTGYEHIVKPRVRDPGFAVEYRREIALVAFDMLVNHLLAEHPEPVASGREDV